MLKGAVRNCLIICLSIFNFAIALNLNDFGWKQLIPTKKHKQNASSSVSEASPPDSTNNYCGIPYKYNAMCLDSSYAAHQDSATGNNSSVSSAQSKYNMSGAFNNDSSQQVGVQRALGGAAAQALVNSSTPLINRIDIPIDIDSNTKLKLNQQQIQIDVSY
jgi:hypothetical protein